MVCSNAIVHASGYLTARRYAPSPQATRAETRLTVYRAHAGFGDFFYKSEDISESVNSFHSGLIFFSSLGHDMSTNAFVVSILFPGRISLVRTDFFDYPEKVKIFMKFGS